MRPRARPSGTSISDTGDLLVVAGSILSSQVGRKATRPIVKSNFGGRLNLRTVGQKKKMARRRPSANGPPPSETENQFLSSQADISSSIEVAGGSLFPRAANRPAIQRHFCVSIDWFCSDRWTPKSRTAPEGVTRTWSRRVSLFEDGKVQPGGTKRSAISTIRANKTAMLSTCTQ